MAKLLRLFNEWEIQLLVLFSFTLQVFLFFTGGLRRRATSKFIRLLIWMAYLGADSVAMYALGFLSRHEDATAINCTSFHQLALFWAPFLLIHLGGQDTITAFAIEDNNLWLRHLLTLVVQATLALYIFWKSTSGPCMQLIVPSILLFVTGTIKYGERTWALWCGGSLENLDSLDSSTFPGYIRRPIERDTCYSDIISRALCSILGVRDVFANYGVYPSILDLMREKQTVHLDMLPKLLEIELGLMYDDIYTKATVIRTRGGFILWCISLISFVAAFVLFFVSNKQPYNPVDTAITYALFIGGFSLEVCAIFITMMSPWTWLWLKHREHSELSRFLSSINIEWQRKRQLWSYSMGQYSLLNHLGPNDQLQSGLLKRLVMAAIRKVVNLVCGRLWISKLLYTKFVEADKEIMGCVVRAVVQYRSAESSMGRQFPNVSPLLGRILSPPSWGLVDVIVGLHTYTELVLMRYFGTSDAARVCRKISNYMLYLLATHPEMLPVKESRLPFLLDASVTAGNLGNNSGRNDVIQRRANAIFGRLGLTGPFWAHTLDLETHLLEIHEAWIGLLIYAAGKSRPKAHAAQLARGGELLTFVWLLMAHHLLGDVHHRFQLADIFHVEGAAIHPVPS